MKTLDKKGFTLIELLVVIAIIGILSSVVLASLSTASSKGTLAAGEEFDSNVSDSIGEDLVGQWPLNIAPISNVTQDTSGNNNNGTVSGATYSSTAGFSGGGAYYFNGSANISVGTPSQLNLNGLDAFTETAWINSSNSNSSSNQEIIDRHTNGLDAQGTLRLSSGKLQFLLTTTSGFISESSGASIPSNQWTFVAVGYDGAHVIFYINGKLDSSDSVTGTVDVADYAPVNIGSYQDSTEWFSGYIDEVRIYTSAITLSEVQRLYAEGKMSHVSLALQ